MAARKLPATAAAEGAFGGWRGPGWTDGGGSWVAVFAGKRCRHGDAIELGNMDRCLSGSAATTETSTAVTTGAVGPDSAGKVAGRLDGRNPSGTPSFGRDGKSLDPAG